MPRTTPRHWAACIGFSTRCSAFLSYFDRVLKGLDALGLPERLETGR